MKEVSLAFAALLSLALSGCVIHVGPDDESRYVGKDDVAKQEARNRDAISRLQLGSTLDQVLAQLGEPDFAEATMIGGHEIRLLRYRTHRSHADGDTTRDETTPLVFQDGALAGIGEHAAESAMAK